MPPSSPARSVAVHTVELTQPLPDRIEPGAFSHVRCFLLWDNKPIGSLELANPPIEATQLRAAIVAGLGEKVIDRGDGFELTPAAAAAIASLPSLSPEVSVSIVIATYDRPDDLRRCLQSLRAQQSQRAIETIVVDNHPASGLTPPVVAEFPGVVLVSEARQGGSYARNTGIVHSHGEIVVTIDDDVTTAPDWLERLIAPFARPEVMIVTGNILPIELAYPAQQVFEVYGSGGLSRGFSRFEGDADWFDRPGLAVPTWKLGATANAAFRASLFHHPDIGLLSEVLGPGMPTGGAEDIDLFYRTLKAGFTICYEPIAYVWHRHRRDWSALRRQIYSYSKGVIAYHLITLWRDRDLRPIPTLLIFLPPYHLKQVLSRLGGSSYPIWLVFWEVMGHLAAPAALWRSHRTVQRQARSAPYLPVSQRPAPPDSSSSLAAPLLSPH